MLERVMIISGESSGELYGSLLAYSLKSLHPNIRIVGVGGFRMQSAGVELISGISGAFGLTEAFQAYKKVRDTFNKVKNALVSFKPQILILIDYPDFNIRLAKKAKKLNIKILYYVSPQIWAWRSSRIKTIGRLVDKMAVILPFEEAIYKEAGIPCEFVGHPAVDEIKRLIEESGYSLDDIGSENLKKKVRLELAISDSKTIIALMPGSRPHEIKNLLPVMSDIISELSKNNHYNFIIPVAPNLDAKHLVLFDSLKKRFPDCCIISRDAIKSLITSDMAVIASGTATFQAALLGVPMVVIYKLSPLSYFLGRLLVNIEHFSLVNILLDKSINELPIMRIKELLQNEVNKDNIIAEILKISEDDKHREMIQSVLFKIRELFINKNASIRVSELIEDLYKS